MHFLRRLWHLFKSGEIQTIAGALSFATLLSFIPFLAVTLATIKYFDGLSVLYPKAEALVLAYFQDPTGVDGAKILAKFFRRIQLAKFGAWGFVGLILSSAMMVNNMERGIHMIWQLKSRRSLLSRLSLSALIMVLFPVALAIYAGIASLKSNTDLWLMISPQYLNFVITVLILSTIYKILPNVRVPLVAALVGGFFTTIGLMVLYGSFKSITKSIFVLGKMYGSFAAFPTLLLWIFLTWMVILLGSVVTASLSKDVSS